MRGHARGCGRDYLGIHFTHRGALVLGACILAIMLPMMPFRTDGAEKGPSGDLTIYSVWEPSDCDFLAAAFNKVYPNIKVKTFGNEGGRGGLVERLITEINAGKNFCDVYRFAMPEVTEVLKRGWLTPYFPPTETNIDQRFVFKDGLLHTNCLLVYMSAYNTNSISKNDLPKTWDELLQPKWKGKIATDIQPNDVVAGILIKMGVEKGWDFLQKISKNVVLRRGRTLIVELLSTGEIPLTIDAYAHRVAALQKKGAPIDAVPLPYYFAAPNVQGVMKKAPNTENAKRWIDWSASPAGQEAIAQLSRGTVGKTLGTKDPQGHLLEGRDLVPILPSNLPMDYNELSQKASKIFVTGL